MMAVLLDEILVSEGIPPEEMQGEDLACISLNERRRRVYRH